MPIAIIGWMGACFVPGDGQADENGRVAIMTTHNSEVVETPELAWEEAKKLGEKHNAPEFLAIQPVTTKKNRPRRLITLAIYMKKTPKTLPPHLEGAILLAGSWDDVGTAYIYYERS